MTNYITHLKHTSEEEKITAKESHRGTHGLSEQSSSEWGKQQ